MSRSYRRSVNSNAAIVLAAESSQRVESPKQLLDLNDRPLLEQVVADVMTWPVDSVVVVIGACVDAILEAVDFGEALVAIDESWEVGLASSLRVGLDVLARDPKWDGALVALGDQPAIPEAVPGRLIAAAAETRRPATVPVYRYQRGNPMFFDRSLWPRLMTLTGDGGTATLLASHPELVEEVRFPELPPRRIETAEDVADLIAAMRHDTGRAASH